MSALLRQFRRAPGRISASVFALALAVGAIGVLAIPAVSEGSLHEAVDRDGLADIIVSTTPLDPVQIERIAALPNVVAAEGGIDLASQIGDDGVRLVGLAAARTMDRVTLTAGRQPNAPGEVVVDPSLGDVGESVTLSGTDYTIVGTGTTLWWSDVEAAFADLETVRSLAPQQGTNRLVITASNDDAESLREIVDAVRSELAPQGEAFTEFPVYLPDGTTPIDADIRQVSSLIGLLGIVAGIVALVLLASTTNTLITERTREVAVMRALGGRQRALRRRLRRIAIGITVAALVVGLPLGVFISNLIARMVLEKFVGITPDLAFDWRVLVGSAVGMLLGARIVAARAARRVTNLPLAEALRDREGSPFGRTALQRLLTRIPTGGLSNRIATRSTMHRPARTIAVVAQIATAVGAAFLVPSLASSVNEYNTASHDVWQWESRLVARDAGLPFPAAAADADPASEAGIWVFGEIGDWEVDAFGVTTDTKMFDPTLSEGRWIAPSAHEAVVSAGFAERNDLAVGDPVDVELAAKTVTYEIVGLSDDFGRAVYVDRDEFATEAGAPGMANVVWSSNTSASVDIDVPVSLETADELAAADGAGREAIVAIFGAIGLIVAGVAALAVVSSMTVSLFERRHELAAMQAIGASKRRLRGLLVRELLPVGAVGVTLGLLLGALGTRGIIMSFESSNAVDIGVVDAFASVPFIVAGALLTLVGLAALAVRAAARRPIAVTLRGAA
jgi:putative ABC transport system permease protein